MSETIEHKGRVSDIQDNKIIVTIISKSMCASCHAKGACISGDSKEKIIEVKTSNLSNYIIGDEITVCLERKIGFKAVLIGFFFPFLVSIPDRYAKNDNHKKRPINVYSSGVSFP